MSRYEIGDEVALAPSMWRAYPRADIGRWRGVLRITKQLPDGYAVANADGEETAKIPPSHLTLVRRAAEECEWAERGAPVPDLTSSVQAIA